MSSTENSDNNGNEKTGFVGFAFGRIILIVIIVCASFWLLHQGISYLGDHEISKQIIEKNQKANDAQLQHEADMHNQKLALGNGEQIPVHETAPTSSGHSPKTIKDVLVAIDPPKPTGVLFVEASYESLEYELHERFWGWRPNDILRFTDNVNNFQKGVLEVTRKTVGELYDSISRTGSTVAYDKNLENAQNWLRGVQPNRLWFPLLQSPEGKYGDAIKELKKYRNKLMAGEANFYNRADNLIPLLKAYRNLLGSCDDNLVKTTEQNGDPVSMFDADNYFYYAQGVASAVETVLNAIEADFHTILLTRYGEESLHHAIESCHKATQINPWYITDASLSGTLANHRANMATAISHARFHLGVLIRTLST